MRILVISDTHGNYPSALRACDLAEPVDCLIHLGDGAEDVAMLSQIVDIKLIHVAGNCDTGSDAPRELLWECSGKRLLLAHGDRYFVKSGMERLEQRGLETGADVVLFGHTHCAMITIKSDVLFVNPGSLMSSAKNATYAILEITTAGITADIYNFPS